MAAKGKSKSTGKGKSGLAGKMKIKAGPSGKMYGAQDVVAQKPFETATSASRKNRSYAK